MSKIHKQLDDEIYSCTFPKLHLYSAMISCLCALLLEVIRSKMASLSLPKEHKETFLTTTISMTENDSDSLTVLLSWPLCEILCVTIQPTSEEDERRPLRLCSQKLWRSKVLTDAFHSIVKGLSISTGIEVGSTCYCASEHL